MNSILLNLNETESFVNKIASSHTTDPLVVRISDDVILPQYKDDQISISDFSMVLILLESCWVFNRKLFGKVLYYYYWASKNLILGKLPNSKHCIKALKKEIDKKSKRFQGTGSKIKAQWTLYSNYVIGHEAIHHCFSHNETYKENAMRECVNIINEGFSELSKKFEGIDSERNIYQEILKVINRGNCIPVEECACDREIIKYIHKTYIEPYVKSANLSEEKYISWLNQLLLSIYMIHYEGTMNDLRSYRQLRLPDLKKEGPLSKRYKNEHLEKEYIRLFCDTYTLWEISISPNYNPWFAYNTIIEEDVKMPLKLIKTIGLFNLYHSTIGTSENPNKELDNDIHNEMDEINADIFSLLLETT